MIVISEINNSKCLCIRAHGGLYDINLYIKLCCRNWFLEGVLLRIDSCTLVLSS